MKVLPKRYLSFVVALALTASAFGQQPSSPVIDRLRQKVIYLASDMLDGRRTGTQGANDAAHFIAGEFNLLGLRPGMRGARPARTRGELRSRYLQPFPYVSKVELGRSNSFKITSPDGGSIDLRVGEDWMPLGFSANAAILNAPAVFVGFGLTASEFKYDDYQGADVKDRVAIALSGTPDGDNPHGQFSRFSDVRFKAAIARSHGAKALLMIASEQVLTNDRLSRLSYDNSGDAGLPVVVISRQTAQRLLGLNGVTKSFSDFEVEMRRDLSAQGTKEIRGYNVTVSVRFQILPKVSFTINTDVIRRESPSYNVIGILPGSDPKLKDEAIVIGAHYDHLGRGGQGSLAQREGEIHYGADDNASGTAGVIELARIFSRQTPKPRRTIVFIGFSGEEEGLIGSSYYVNHPVVPLANTVAMINLDMIGRLNNQKLVIGGVGTAAEWRPLIDRANSESRIRMAALTSAMEGREREPQLIVNPREDSTGGPIVVGANGRPVVTLEFPKITRDTMTPFSLTLNEDGYGPSDHSSFYGKQIPVLFFWTGTHADYHKPTDTYEKINYDGLARITLFVASIIRDIDKIDSRPTYKLAQAPTTARSSGFRVYLGTIPNYADSTDGLLLDGVRDDSPAARAGLKGGDKIVKMAGKDVKNVYDYTYALGEMKAGTEYEVEIVRAGQRMTLKITPEARR